VNKLQFVKRKRIDELKWNSCIDNSANSLPYTYSWYLDIVAENWDALVWNDYEFIMPLVWLRKFGVPCLYQPYCCQQLGVFGNNPTETLLNQFLHETINKYHYIHINLNPSVELVRNKFHLFPRKNLLLNLNNPYSVLAKAYSENHLRNISKAGKTGLRFSETEVKTFQKFYFQNINRTKENFQPKHEKIVEKLTETVIEKKAGKIYSVSDKDNHLVAACLFLFHKNRIINIINTSSAEGKKNGASHFLFDQIIRLHVTQNLFLDFEGSSIPGVARFYEGFGAKTEMFYQLKTNFLKQILNLK
jgi:hypothetical protein